MRFLILLVATSVFAADVDKLIENGHWKRAREAADVALRTNPNDAAAAYHASVAHKAFGELEEARKLGETSVRLDPKNAEYHRNLADIYGDLANQAGPLKLIGLARKCHAEVDAAAALNPKDPENLEALMIYSLEAPSIVGGDKRKAADLAEQIAKIDAVRGYFAKARIEQKDKREQAEHEFYEKAVQANPRSYAAQTKLANSFLNRKEYAATEQHAREALKIDADQISAYKLLAASLVYLKRVDEAVAVVQRAESAIPDDFAPYLSAARAMLALGSDLDKAEAYIRKYLSQPPEGEEPPLAGAHWSLGLVFEKQGRKVEARGELETALRLKPDFEQAKRDLKRLR
jgi:tetratricopeptide (TPR) repeat protein